MNKRGKIIVSIVGIFIVLLALIGITYGYFLTRVTGNTNDNSILITTANLELVYGDGNGIITAENIYPTLDENEYAVTKTFTVTNNGNSYTTYGVYLENVINTFEDTKDVTLTVSCSSTITDEEGNQNTDVCSGFATYSEVYPSVNKQLFTMDIEVSEVHTYTLKVRYADDGTDQSNDMGKTIGGKVQIYNPNDVFSIEGNVVSATISDDTVQTDTIGKIDETMYYVEVQSDPVTSQISSDGSYNVNGLTPGTHTVYVKSKSDNSVVASKTLTVKKGVVSGIDDDGVVNITREDSRVIVDVTVDISNKELALDTTGVEFKYKESSTGWFTFDSSTQTATLNTYASGTNIDELVIPKTIDGVEVKNVVIADAVINFLITQTGIESVNINSGSQNYVYLSNTVNSVVATNYEINVVELSDDNENFKLLNGDLYTINDVLVLDCGEIEAVLKGTVTDYSALPTNASKGDAYYCENSYRIVADEYSSIGTVTFTTDSNTQVTSSGLTGYTGSEDSTYVIPEYSALENLIGSTPKSVLFMPSVGEQFVCDVTRIYHNNSTADDPYVSYGIDGTINGSYGYYLEGDVTVVVYDYITYPAGNYVYNGTRWVLN